MLSHKFTGRERELAGIATHLKLSTHMLYTKCVLVGIPGVGKSQTALQYALGRTDATNIQAYEWILFARAPDKNTLLSEICALGSELGLFDENLVNEHSRAVADRVKRWLRVHSRWLFIFDNVTDSNDVLEYLPSDGEGHVLFTTRSQIVAESLTPPNNIIEITILPEDSAINLVLRISPALNPLSDRQRDAAKRIAHFSYGLPLAIEQFVKFSELAGVGWERALELVQSRAALLQQQSFCTNHENNLSVGAIVVSTMEILHRNNPEAASLYKLLVYMSTSSIPLVLLNGATGKLEEYFSRSHTYIHGPVRTAVDQVRLSSEARNSSKPFSIFDYDPFDKELYRRLLRKGSYSKKSTQTDLPRIDSAPDIEMMELWSNQKRSLQAALADTLQLNNALNVLESSGLIRLIRNKQEIWIHDLFAELTRAVVESESMKISEGVAHLAATTVYLNFPTPATAPSPDSCLRCLPHAIAAHGHLQNARILSDTTIGAELSHLIASTLRWTSGNKPDIHLSFLKYYRDALGGYQKAWKRLQTTPGIDFERITLSTFADYAREDELAGYAVPRHLWYYERFGRSAPWRCIQTMMKLGMLLMDHDELDEGLKMVLMAAGLNERIFGLDQQDTIEALSLCMYGHIKKQEWQKAYDFACRKAEGVMGLRPASKKERKKLKGQLMIYENGGLGTTDTGADMARDCGSCAMHIPGLEGMALQWSKLYLSARLHVYGEDSRYCHGAMKMVARAYEALGNLPASLLWFARAVETCLDGKDFYTLLAEDYDRWGALMMRDELADEAIDEFTRIRTKVEEESIELVPALDRFVHGVHRQAQRWEQVKPKVDIEDVGRMDNQGEI